MKLEELLNYINEKASEGLTKMDITIELGEGSVDEFYVVKTKETFVYGDEEEQDRKINEVRQDPGFAGVDKKFKAGKVSKKTGEELSPDTYTVVAKILH